MDIHEPSEDIARFHLGFHVTQVGRDGIEPNGHPIMRGGILVHQHE